MERKKPNEKYFHIFGSTYYILADREYHRKLDAKFDEGMFLGYSLNSRMYRVFNKRTQTIMETINVIVNENKKISHKHPDDDEFFYDSKT